MSIPEITDTGVRGFLKWFQTVQPGLYAKVAPEITKRVPTAFSDYHAGGWRVAGLSHADAVTRLNALGSLRDTTGTGTVYDASGNPVSFNVSSGMTLPSVDVSTAANAGTTPTTTTSLISNIVSGISALYMTKQQADIQQQVVNTQLARAAAGLPPLPSSLSQLGVPQVSVGLSAGTGTGLMIAGVAVAGIFLFGMMGRKRRTA